jgi:hypothetical protein
MDMPFSYEYKVQGKTVIIPMGGAVITLSIKNNTTLEGPGGNIFIKK